MLTDPVGQKLNQDTVAMTRLYRPMSVASVGKTRVAAGDSNVWGLEDPSSEVASLPPTWTMGRDDSKDAIFVS